MRHAMAVMAICVCLLGACNGDERLVLPPGKPPEGVSGDDTGLEPLGGFRRGELKIRPGDIAIFTGAHFRALHDVTLKSAELLRIDDGVSVVGIRAYFTNPGSRLLTGFPGQLCAPRPTGAATFPGSHPVTGLRVPKGEKVAVAVFATADAPGEYVLEGIEVDYETSRVSSTASAAGRATMVIHVDSASSDDEFDGCWPVPTPWVTS